MRRTSSPRSRSIPAGATAKSSESAVLPRPHLSRRHHGHTNTAGRRISYRSECWRRHRRRIQTASAWAAWRQLPRSLATRRSSFGAKGMYGTGVGRYGSSTIADVTANDWSSHLAASRLLGFGTLEMNPTPRLDALLLIDYGGVDYIGRDHARRATAHSATGFTQLACTSSLRPHSRWRHMGRHWGTPSLPSAMVAAASNSECLEHDPASTAVPTGCYPDGNCGARHKDVQEFTAGYWYDFYSGPNGRLRQGSSTATFERISGPARVARATQRRRQGYRQHVLDLLPLLPPINLRLLRKTKGAVLIGLPLILCQP